MAIKLTNAEKGIQRRAERDDARRDPEGSEIEQLKLAFDFALSPMYPHDEAPELTEEQVEKERQLRAVYRLRIARGYGDACAQIQDMYGVSIATAKRLIAQSVEYFGEVGLEDRELDKLLKVQRLERIANRIDDSPHIDDDQRFRLLVETERLIIKIKGYDQPDQLNPKEIAEQLQPPHVVRSTDPKVFDRMGAEEANVENDGD